jgi:outer membrane lipoprotein-sorting protein
MIKLIVFSILLSLLLSSCSWKPEKEIITKAEVYIPTINVVSRPKPLTLRNADVIVITEKNLKEVIQRVKDMQGSFVVYALDPKSFESLAINMEEIKLYIEQQNKIILYYEKAVTNEEKDRTKSR